MENINIGGDRLGSGAKINVALKNFERSTHDLGYIWRNTQAPGTLVPFMVEVGLPGDTFDINLATSVKTLPTVGPLFASFKLQLDVFSCPVRLYEGKLHNNKLNIGLDMSKIKLPQLLLQGKGFNTKGDKLNQEQINSSSLLSYLGIRGIGYVERGKNISRKKNAIPLLAYWDIYKNYYANKQEEKGAYIHHTDDNFKILQAQINGQEILTAGQLANIKDRRLTINNIQNLTIRGKGLYAKNVYIQLANNGVLNGKELYDIQGENTHLEFYPRNIEKYANDIVLRVNIIPEPTGIKIKTFDLANIDEMREDIYVHSKYNYPFEVSKNSVEPYGNILQQKESDGQMFSSMNQEGLALKTYQSDIFNNWISTEWLDGENGINQITAIDTSSGKFTMDTLNLSKKVYDMLNRIAVSGGSYQDWLEAVYSHKSWNKAETPIYYGGLSQEIVFEEVISNTGTSDEPLGTLAGKGILNDKRKGGNVTIKCDEPTFIIGIVSITPRIDYSQGNEWYTRLKTMNDFHKPSLDGIGFQDLITEQMVSWESHGENDDSETLYSAGKQPAWINYMTSYNRCYGGFAELNNQMFMTLNRRYEIDEVTGRVKDLTTYIDPSKFNYAFAQTDLNAQNFFIQIAVNNIARRKMSAKQIPNL